MNHEIQQALRDKADNWKVQNIENEVFKASREIREVDKEVEKLKNIISNQSEVIRQLITFLIEENKNDNNYNNLTSLKQQL